MHQEVTMTKNQGSFVGTVGETRYTAAPSVIGMEVETKPVLRALKLDCRHTSDGVTRQMIKMIDLSGHFGQGNWKVDELYPTVQSAAIGVLKKYRFHLNVAFCTQILADDILLYYADRKNDRILVDSSDDLKVFLDGCEKSEDCTLMACRFYQYEA